jgi:diaminopimelate decarboxylase
VGKLTFKDINAITSVYGESFYILDSDIFEYNCFNLLNIFRKYYTLTNIAYSYKTNYIPQLVKIVDRIGGYAEVVSEMEIEIAKKAGVDYKKIIWNGPVKSLNTMECFLVSGGTINIDNKYEFLQILDIANKHNSSKINIGIRCNYDIGDDVVSRFGFDVDGEDIYFVLEEIKKHKNICLLNLQVHFAKRHLKYWPAKVDGILNFYNKVISEYNIYPKYLDLGGGISGEMPDNIREQLNIESFSLDDYARIIAKRFNDYFVDKDNKPWLFIEPGTAVAADCMRYVCKVESIKKIRNKTIINTNGSQKNISMGSINPPIEIISSGSSNYIVSNADIAGYTCIESDYLYRDFNGSIGIGDYIVINNCGSYSVVMKPPFIFPNVPVIDISSGEIVEIKRAEKVEDIFCTYINF